MQRQVITIHPDGGVSGLQRKPGQGLDISKLGKAQIKRASEIVWDEDYQLWYVHLLDGRFSGLPVCLYLAILAGLDVEKIAGLQSYRKDDMALLFTDYDQAVKCEIAFLDALRLKGQYA